MQFESLQFDSQLPDCQVYETEHVRNNTILGLWQWITLIWAIIDFDMSDICLISADMSDICWYLSDIGHIGNLGSFTKAILLQKCSISLISPDIAIRSRSSRSDWLHQIHRQTDLHMDGRTNMKKLRPPTQKAAARQKKCFKNSKKSNRYLKSKVSPLRGIKSSNLI
mgnify:CR=1 FL=1